MRFIVLAHRHQMCPRHEDIGRLQHGVAHQPKGQRVVVEVGCARHVFDAGQPLQPRQSHQHLKDQVHLVHRMHRRLQIDRAPGGVDPSSEVIEYDIGDILTQRHHMLFFRPGGQCVQVSDDKETLVLVLQAHAVGKAANIVPQMQLASRSIARQNPLPLHSPRSSIRLVPVCCKAKRPSRPAATGTRGVSRGATLVGQISLCPPLERQMPPFERDNGAQPAQATHFTCAAPRPIRRPPFAPLLQPVGALCARHGRLLFRLKALARY